MVGPEERVEDRVERVEVPETPEEQALEAIRMQGPERAERSSSSARESWMEGTGEPCRHGALRGQRRQVSRAVGLEVGR